MNLASLSLGLITPFRAIGLSLRDSSCWITVWPPSAENIVALSCIDQIANGRQHILRLPRSSQEACSIVSITLCEKRAVMEMETCQQWSQGARTKWKGIRIVRT